MSETNERQEAIAIAVRLIKTASIEGVDASDLLLLARRFLRDDEMLNDLVTMDAYPAMSVKAKAAGGFGLAPLKDYPL